ncbi:hypothetical protein [Treponema sp. Marseille-Q4523]|uniref:hypothetical protein n=1 Tax=Treponema sp. Marseille-Q4523 TaxID=2810610 RepID=UPI001961B1C7|nr:hypothetical protein [Treponema sp. Marseille-Q4523]MBM7022133.1 hypothetical protein [Treponema sp. Marseille-Q4523]
MRMGGGMRKNCHVYELFFLAACCLCFFGCGLEEYYVLEAPFRIYNTPNADTTYDNKYFDFVTNETGNSSMSTSFDFLGTAVYYKIYNRYESIGSVTSALSSANNSTEYSAAATLLINTYKYRELGTASGTTTPLIASTGADRRIYIRLTNYQNDARYKAKIIIGYAGDSSIVATMVPKREGNRNSFDFGRTGAKDPEPASGDDDYNYSSSGFSSSYPNTYFVDMYALSVGRDTTYTTYYSKVLHLGTVAVNAVSEDN